MRIPSDRRATAAFEKATIGAFDKLAAQPAVAGVLRTLGRYYGQIICALIYIPVTIYR